MKSRAGPKEEKKMHCVNDFTHPPLSAGRAPFGKLHFSPHSLLPTWCDVHYTGRPSSNGILAGNKFCPEDVTNLKFAAESGRHWSQCSSALKKMKSGNSFPSGGPVVFTPLWLGGLSTFFSPSMSDTLLIFYLKLAAKTLTGNWLTINNAINLKKRKAEIRISPFRKTAGPGSATRKFTLQGRNQTGG